LVLQRFSAFVNGSETVPDPLGEGHVSLVESKAGERRKALDLGRSISHVPRYFESAEHG